MQRIYPTAAAPAQSYTVYGLFCMCDLSFKNIYLTIVNCMVYALWAQNGKKDYISLYNCCCIVKLLFEMCIPVTYKNKNMSIFLTCKSFCDNLKMKSLVYIIMIKYHQGRLMTVQTAKTKCTLTTLLNVHVFLMPFFSKLIIFVYFQEDILHLLLNSFRNTQVCKPLVFDS